MREYSDQAKNVFCLFDAMRYPIAFRASDNKSSKFKAAALVGRVVANGVFFSFNCNKKALCCRSYSNVTHYTQCN